MTLVALVTGAGSGIGESVARRYADEGAAIVVVDLKRAAGEAVTESIARDGGTAIFVDADVSRAEDCDRMVRTARERFGRFDFACNNAGIGGENNATADYSVEGWQRIIAVNLTSVFYGLKYEIPLLLEHGGSPS